MHAFAIAETETMISKVLIASLAVGASAFSPAAAGSVVSQSKVVAAAPVAPVSLERAVAPVMNADGEHETEYEM